MSDDPKFCRDCKHHRNHPNFRYGVCKSPVYNNKYDLVTGKPIPKNARDARYNDVQCGLTGDLFEAIE